MWTRLSKAVESMRSADPAHEPVEDSSAGRLLQVFGSAPQPRTMMWGQDAPSLRAGALLDSLITQLSGFAPGPDVNSLPPLAHRIVAEPADDAPGQEAAAIFGTVGGRAAFARARAGGGFDVYAADPLRHLAGTAEAGQPIRALALGSDGTRDVLVTGGDDSTLWTWDLTGSEGLLHARGGHGGAVRAVAFPADPDGSLVYSGGADGNVWAWGSPDGHEAGALTGHEGSVNALAGARMGELGLLVSGGDDGTVRIRNTATGETLRTFTTGADWINAVAVTGSEGRGLVAAGGSDGVVRVWDLAAEAPTRALSGHTAAVTGLAFLDLGGRAVLASCAYDGTVRTWDAATGEAMNSWSAQDAWPAALAAAPSPGGPVIASGGATGTVRLWNPEGTELRALTTGRGPVQALALAESEEGAVAAVGSLDGSLGLWDVATGSVRQVLAPDGGPVTSLGFGPGAHTLVCGTAQGTVRVHSGPDWALQLVPTPHTGAVAALAFLPVAGGLVASAGADRTVRTWEAGTGRPLLRLRGHESGVTVLAAGQSDAGPALASADEDGAVLVWDALSGRRLRDFRTEGPVTALALGTVEGVHVLAAAERGGPIRVWDLGSGAELAASDTGGDDVLTLTVCALDGTTVLLAGTRDGEILARRLPDGAEMGVIDVALTPLALSFAPPSTLRIAGGDGVTTVAFAPEVAGRDTA
ncbi:hypothetical protein MHW47_09010 [Streptomyces sp. OfavH-34-F]|uniref:WD40 repeat domain-containing protein n=1 Tax=Streptomyces sp. OfavH-34-F TaxID=2917760 RepID=UPI001EF19187|nr:WD40 repeat domain-containing protein [Streptomyces sp. OfavH-34-F]MCG7524574.1 hypothetical protein [Streptomyces sp. OfavH-34-F]